MADYRRVMGKHLRSGVNVGMHVHDAFTSYCEDVGKRDVRSKNKFATTFKKWTDEKFDVGSIQSLFSRIKQGEGVHLDRAWAILYCLRYLDDPDSTRETRWQSARDYAEEIERKILESDEAGEPRTYRSINAGEDPPHPEDLFDLDTDQTSDVPFILYYKPGNSRLDVRIRTSLFSQLPGAVFVERPESVLDLQETIVAATKQLSQATHFIPVISGRDANCALLKRCFVHARQEGIGVLPIFTERDPKQPPPSWLLDFESINALDPARLDSIDETLTTLTQPDKVSFASPDLVQPYVVRNGKLDEIKSALLAPESNGVALSTSIQGAGGYGKTQLANALCRDDDVRAFFHDGVFRIVIGFEARKSDVASKVLSIIRQLSDDDMLILENDDEIASSLATMIGSGKILLVVDDVWQAAQLDPLRINTPQLAEVCPNARLLITTRRAQFKRDFSSVIEIDKMEAKEAVKLLCHGLKLDIYQHERRLLSLCEKLFRWSQLLAAANLFLLRATTEFGQSLTHALADLEAEIDSGISGLDPRKPTDQTEAAGWSIALGLCAIDPEVDDREVAGQYFSAKRDLTEIGQRFSELGVFPEDRDIPDTVAALLWKTTAGYTFGDTRNLLKEFADVAVLQQYAIEGREGSFTIHDNHANFAKHILRSRNGLNGLHAQFGIALKKANWLEAIGPSRSQVYFLSDGVAHLKAGNELNEAAEILTDFDWMQRKLQHIDDPAVLYKDYLGQDMGPEVRLIGLALALSLPTLRKDKSQLANQLVGRLRGLHA